MSNQAPIPQEAFDWYDEYAHGQIDRRTFLNRLASLAATGLSVSVLASALMPDYSKAEQISFNDPDIKASYVNFASPEGHGEGRGYLVVPQTDAANHPSVLVIHENRGLNPYVKDVARRLGKAGFLAFAPDALFPLGGYPGNDDEGKKMQRSMDRSKIEKDLITAALFIKNHELSNKQLGAVGFCFGGYIVNMLAAVIPDQLNAGVAYYGTPADVSIQKNVTGPLQIHLGEDDKRVNATWPDYEKQLEANNAEFEMFMYKDAKHGFHNDSTSRYDSDAAELSWQRTTAFFNKHLRKL